jgi:hypothetical protein
MAGTASSRHALKVVTRFGGDGTAGLQGAGLNISTPSGSSFLLPWPTEPDSQVLMRRSRCPVQTIRAAGGAELGYIGRHGMNSCSRWGAGRSSQMRSEVGSWPNRFLSFANHLGDLSLDGDQHSWDKLARSRRARGSARALTRQRDHRQAPPPHTRPFPPCLGPRHEERH